uniref:Uncharacterized protein n=1 Tax=Tanacetum cinerariifolium TaxID=118510 RepID=A0A6L2M1Z2_TANCI|nr:hypothetical protein [Tanacetum cinerariifolium]
MMEGLVARLSSSDSVICKSLRCKEPSDAELFTYMMLLYEACHYFKGGGLNIVGQRPAKLAESCKVPFMFHGIRVSVSDIQIQHLGVQPGEALVVSCALVMHHYQDETISKQNHRTE